MARRRAVDDDEVVAPRGARPPLGAPELHAFAIVTSSRAPGAAARNAPNALDAVSAWATRREPTTEVAHSSSAAGGSTVVAHSPSRSPTSAPGVPGGPCSSRVARVWPEISQRIVRRPARAASMARAIATVVRPVPPLPVTNMSSRSSG